MEQIKGGVKGIPLCPADRLGQADVIMGSLKCDLSHITVHTVNNHTHTLQGNSNARRQPSGNRQTYRLACTCAHVEIHTSIHTQTKQQPHTHKKTCMYIHTELHAQKYATHRCMRTRTCVFKAGLFETGNQFKSGELESGSETLPHPSCPKETQETNTQLSQWTMFF